MAFSASGWNGNVAGGGQNGVKLHTYKSADALATVAGSGYFNNAAGEIDTGDSVLVNSTATTGGGNKWYRLTNTSGTITAATHAT